MESLYKGSQVDGAQGESIEGLPVVSDVAERSANDRASVSEMDHWLRLWDVFEALQDCADESGATPSEADELVLAAYHEIQRVLVPAPGTEEPGMAPA